VNPSSGVPTVLLVDEDIGFLWWLGEIFREIGFRCFPALNTADAIAIARAPSIDIALLVLEPGMLGARSVIDAFENKTMPKILLLADNELSTRPALRADAVLVRPSATESISRADWVVRLKKLILKMDARAAS
jgi:DNA-binding response OmpR family regulator